MQPNLSFTPRYHELSSGTASRGWVPLYNPGREVVAAERSQIEAEGGQVDSQAWAAPYATRAGWRGRQMALIWVGFLALAVAPLLGVYLAEAFNLDWVNQATGLVHAGGVMAVGLGAVSAVLVSLGAVTGLACARAGR
jgi:hypothetical protein